MSFVFDNHLSSKDLNCQVDLVALSPLGLITSKGCSCPLDEIRGTLKEYLSDLDYIYEKCEESIDGTLSWVVLGPLFCNRKKGSRFDSARPNDIKIPAKQ